MNFDEIENNLKKLVVNIDKENFIYDFFLSYGLPKSSVNRLKKGDYNQSKNTNQLIWKKKVFFHQILKNEDIHDVIDEISKTQDVINHGVRFIIVSDFKVLLALDLKSKDTLDIEIIELYKNVNFFLPLIGVEKSEPINENLADIKAADKMGKLYDSILKDNKDLLSNDKDRHGINIFFTRLLFCFFGEDSKIFPKGIFTNSISSFSKEDGSDCDKIIMKIFTLLNTHNRDNANETLKQFPYVNGGLFKNIYKIPKFSKNSRKILIEIGALDWSSINPDILGSMMQAVVSSGERKEIGMHYTSVTNILKIIKPLFLNNLYDELFSAGEDIKKLNKLLKKIYDIIIFDPACGSGNFLVIAYKELSKLEIEIFRRLKKIDKNNWLIVRSGIKLTQFYGIEIDDYAHEAAKLSLWIAEHQNNLSFNEIFNEERSSLPLSLAGNIIQSNATYIDWEKHCPKDKSKQIYIIGNPPYEGSYIQSKEHKNDMKRVFKGVKSFKNLDYVACWFYLAAKYLSGTDYKASFISTKSICQGEQVSLLWPKIFNLGIEINFAYKEFKWNNNAKYNAGVICIIICLGKISRSNKKLYEDSNAKEVKNINAYLIDGPNIIIHKKSFSISKLPKMSYGNKAVDGGNLILNQKEKEDLTNKDIGSLNFIRPIYGADGYLKGEKKYCLWINDNLLSEAFKIKEIKKRIDKVKDMRLKSKDKGANELALRPHQFRDFKEAKKFYIIIPRTSTQRRKYIPIGILDKKSVVTDTTQVIYDPPIYLLAILCSKMHMSWVLTTAGYLGSGIRYSSSLCYNTFPFPKIDNAKIKLLEQNTLDIIDEREKHSEKTMAELYDPDKMPKKLKEIHEKNDLTIDQLYRDKPFINETERINYLFDLHQKIINKDILF